MSSFKAKMNVLGQELDVVAFNYSLGQATDESGRPASGVKGGNFFVQIVSTDEDALIGWMIDPHGKESGDITFYKVDEDATFKKVEFKDAYCVGFSESFNAHSASAMITSLNVSARKLTVAGTAHTNY